MLIKQLLVFSCTFAFCILKAKISDLKHLCEPLPRVQALGTVPRMLCGLTYEELDKCLFSCQRPDVERRK